MNPKNVSVHQITSAADVVASSSFTEVTVTESNGLVRITNGLVAIDYKLAIGTYDVIDLRDETTAIARAHGEVDGLGLIEPARECNREPEPNVTRTWAGQDVHDVLGRGKTLTIITALARDRVELIATFTLREGRSFVALGSGIANHRPYAIRVKSFQPLINGDVFPGLEMKNVRNLNGGAGSTNNRVENGADKACENSLLLTFTASERRHSLVMGGLSYQDFAKYVALGKYDCWNGAAPASFGGSGDPEIPAELGRTWRSIWKRSWQPTNSGPTETVSAQVAALDPVGRLVDSGATYQPNDLFYLDVVTDDPFVALETYGLALRTATGARPNVYNNLTVCGWFSKRNNSVKLIEELETAKKLDMLKTIPVALRLEPDTYCWTDNGNSEQGWWDDEHWRKYGHLVAPYDTFKKWIDAVHAGGATTETYFQCGMPSDDYAEAFPGQMLHNDISQLHRRHSHTSPLVTYDATDPDFEEHMRKVWSYLKECGLGGVKFDYPDLAWRPEGGFEDKAATTASAYRAWFQFCREGLGPKALIHERALAPNCLDVTAGIVDLQRVSGDNQQWSPGMAAICGLRWYKNRVVINYYPDSKSFSAFDAAGRRIEDVPMDELKRRAIITMLYVTSGRIELAASLRTLTPAAVYDIGRAFPMHTTPQSARPVDAFTGVENPRVYAFRVDDHWQQVTLYNDQSTSTKISVPLSGDQPGTGALGLDAARNYYVYGFWSDRLIGKLSGSDKLEQDLEGGEVRMLSVREVLDHPQVLSTNRHLMQGYVDLENVNWNAGEKRLSGVAKVVGGEPFRIVVAGNGRKAISVTVDGAKALLEPHPAGEGLSVVVLERADNGDATWRVDYEHV